MKNFVVNVGFFEYSIKPQEFIWSLIYGASGYVLAAGATAPDDWKAFGVGLTMAVLRVGIAAVFGKQPSDSSTG